MQREITFLAGPRNLTVSRLSGQTDAVSVESTDSRDAGPDAAAALVRL